MTLGTADLYDDINGLEADNMRLRAILQRARPAVEHHWSMMPSGPKKDAALTLLHDVLRAEHKP
jgi:hypothetical protein